MKNFDKDTSLYQTAGETAAAFPPLLMEADRIASTFFTGIHGRRKAGTGETFWQFRDYNTQDDVRNIDWKQSAKSDRTYVRETEWETAQTLLISCANHSGMQYRSQKKLPTKLERSHILALATAILATYAGERVGFLGEKETGYSKKHLVSMALNLEKNDIHTLNANFLPRNAYGLITSDFLAPLDALENEIKFLSSRRIRGIILQVLDPCEYQLHYFGHIRFKDSQSKQSILIRHTENVQNIYNERITTHIKALSKMAMHYGWKHILHTTEKDPSTALQDIWLTMSSNNMIGGY